MEFNLTLYDFRQTPEGKQILSARIQREITGTPEAIERRHNDPDWSFDDSIMHSRDCASRYLHLLFKAIQEGATLSKQVIADIERPLRFCYPSEREYYEAKIKHLKG